MTGEQIPLSQPDITDAEVRAVEQVLRSGRLSLGPAQDAFEQAVAARAGRKYGIAVNSGTSGLHLCVRALGLSQGDEVLTTAFSFIATTNCLLFEHARPVFVDIDPQSYNMDPQALKRAVTPRTRAVLPVEVFGNCEHFPQYERIARRHGLAMIEDCCEALGGRLGGRSAGSFGDCGVFAFYPNKQITSGEGGMIVTDDARLRDLCLSMRNQGRDQSGWLHHVRLGYNYRLSELHAALGLAQMQRLEEILAKRRHVAEMYRSALGDVAEIHLPPMAEPQGASWFVFVVRLADRFGQADRDAVLRELRDGGIGCSAYFPPIHRQPALPEALRTGLSLPHTEHVAARTVALPFYSNLSQEQVGVVKRRLCDALARVGSAGKDRPLA